MCRVESSQPCDVIRWVWAKQACFCIYAVRQSLRSRLRSSEWACHHSRHCRVRLQATPTLQVPRPPDAVGGVGEGLARPPAVVGGVVECLVLATTPLLTTPPEGAPEAAALAQLVGEALPEVLRHEPVDDRVQTAASENESGFWSRFVKFDLGGLGAQLKIKRCSTSFKV